MAHAFSAASTAKHQRLQTDRHVSQAGRGRETRRKPLFCCAPLPEANVRWAGHTTFASTEAKKRRCHLSSFGAAGASRVCAIESEARQAPMTCRGGGGTHNRISRLENGSTVQRGYSQRRAVEAANGRATSTRRLGKSESVGPDGIVRWRGTSNPLRP